jgi:hypothetical protein
VWSYATLELLLVGGFLQHSESHLVGVLDFVHPSGSFDSRDVDYGEAARSRGTVTVRSGLTRKDKLGLSGWLAGAESLISPCWEHDTGGLDRVSRNFTSAHHRLELTFTRIFGAARIIPGLVGISGLLAIWIMGSGVWGVAHSFPLPMVAPISLGAGIGLVRKARRKR